MITLVLIFCLGAECIEHRPVYEEPLSLMACSVGGQIAAAEYLKTHPGWQLKRWRCEVGPRKSDI